MFVCLAVRASTAGATPEAYEKIDLAASPHPGSFQHCTWLAGQKVFDGIPVDIAPFSVSQDLSLAKADEIDGISFKVPSKHYRGLAVVFALESWNRSYGFSAAVRGGGKFAEGEMSFAGYSDPRIQMVGRFNRGSTSFGVFFAVLPFRQEFWGCDGSAVLSFNRRLQQGTFWPDGSTRPMTSGASSGVNLIGVTLISDPSFPVCPLVDKTVEPLFGRAADLFAAPESLMQKLPDGKFVASETPETVEITPDDGSRLRFVLHGARQTRMEVVWKSGQVDSHVLWIQSQTDRLTAAFEGQPKGTAYTNENAAIAVGYLLTKYVRPNLRCYQADGSMVPSGWDYLAARDSLPMASEHVNVVSVRKSPSGRVALWWDGSLVYTFKPTQDRPEDDVAGVRMKFTKGAEYSLVRTDVGSVDRDRFELLDLSANPKAKAFKDAVLVAPDRPEVRMVGKFPVSIVKPLDSADVAICRQGKGAYSMTNDEYHGRDPLFGFGSAVHFRIPARQYERVCVVFALDPDPAKDKILNVRLASYVVNGAGSNRIVDKKLDFSHGLPSKIKVVGKVRLNGQTLPLYAMSVVLDVECIADLAARGDYLDFEFMGAMRDGKPIAGRESAFNVFGATLEASPVTVDVINAPDAPSNVFTQDESDRFLTLALRGETKAGVGCHVEWAATDRFGKKVLTSSADAGRLAKGAVRNLKIDLSRAKDPGLYDLAIVVKDSSSRRLVGRKTRFAVLPPAGRVVEKSESPYATWWFYGLHGTPSSWSAAGPLLQKAGIRKISTAEALTAEAMKKYDVTYTGHVMAPASSGFDSVRGCFKEHEGLDGEQWFVSQVSSKIASVPYADHLMVWHESAPLSLIPEEILGLPVPAATESDIRNAKYINEVGRLARKHFPQLRIQIGNTSASLGAASLPFRGGADPQYYDAIGIETPSQSIMPERLAVYGLQGMLMSKEVASFYAKRPVPAAGCFEYVYRTERALGETMQAAYYMRDVIISLANRMPMISPALLFDVANAYYESMWGAAGLIGRNPSCEPKLSYVAYAALTKALDGVSFLEELPTGSSTVYALSFRRADGMHALAVWCARGEAMLKLDVSAGSQMEMCGKTVPFVKGTVRASEEPSYVLTSGRVRSATIVSRAFRQAEAVASSAMEIFRFDKRDKVEMCPDEKMRSKGHACLPILQPSADFRLAEVSDAERGPCLEVSLDTVTTNVNRYVTEYTTLRLKDPVRVETPQDRIGIWVKGNSSWGRIRFEITDVDGETFVNYMHPSTGVSAWDTLDMEGLLTVNFDGWSFVSCRFEGGLRYDSEKGLSNAPWNVEVSGGYSSNRKVDFPIVVKAVTVCMNREKPGILDFKPTVPSIRLGEIKVTSASNALICSLEPDFGVEFNDMDACVSLNADSVSSTCGLVWTLVSGSSVITGECDSVTGKVKFSGVPIRRSEDNLCTVKAAGAENVLYERTFVIAGGRHVLTWICEDENHAGETGSWSAESDYEEGCVSVEGEDGFVPSAGASDGNRVTVRVKASFDDSEPHDPVDGSQLAFRLNGDCFQVLSGGPQTWLDVAADGVPAVPQRSYELIFDVNYGAGDFGVSVVGENGVVPFESDGIVRFALARTGKSALSEVWFTGSGQVASIYGDYVDASVARTGGVRYDTLEEACASGGPVAVTWPKILAGDALSKVARGSEITLPIVCKPLEVRLAPGILVRPASNQPPGLLAFVSPLTWFDVVTRDEAVTLELNATATPQIGPTDDGPALTFDGTMLHLSVTNAKPGLSYALSSVTDLSKPFEPPTDVWQRFDGVVEGPTTLSAEMVESVAFFKVFVSDR